MGLHQQPPPPTLKDYPTPRVGSSVGGRFKFFSLKLRKRMNLKIPGAISPLCCGFLSTRVKTVWGLLQPSFGELGLKTVKRVAKRKLRFQNEHTRIDFSYNWRIHVTEGEVN